MEKNDATKWLFEQIRDVLIIIKNSLPPVNLEYIAKLRNVKNINWFSDIYTDGELNPVQGGFYINIAFNTSNHRKRFSVAHEIAHTFFYDISPDGIPKRKFLNISRKDEEIACDLAAAEILMPSSLLKSELKKYKSIDLLTSLEMVKIFRVSPIAMFLRLHRLNLLSGLIICSEIRGTKKKPDEIALRNNWRVGTIYGIFAAEHQRFTKILPTCYRNKLEQHARESWDNIGKIITSEIEFCPYKQKKSIKYYFQSIRLQKKNRHQKYFNPNFLATLLYTQIFDLYLSQ